MVMNAIVPLIYPFGLSFRTVNLTPLSYQKPKHISKNFGAKINKYYLQLIKNRKIFINIRMLIPAFRNDNLLNYFYTRKYIFLIIPAYFHCAKVIPCPIVLQGQGKF